MLEFIRMVTEPRMLLLVGAVWLGFAGAAVASEPTQITVYEAHERVKRGEIVLVDIRAPKEWSQSGIAAVAKTITMYQPAAHFIQALRMARGGNPGKPVALICATGGRTHRLQKALHKAGMDNVINVVGGMFGTWRHRGWIRAGLPVRKWSRQRE